MGIAKIIIGGPTHEIYYTCMYRVHVQFACSYLLILNTYMYCSFVHSVLLQIGYS